MARLCHATTNDIASIFTRLRQSFQVAARARSRGRGTTASAADVLVSILLLEVEPNRKPLSVFHSSWGASTHFASHARYGSSYLCSSVPFISAISSLPCSSGPNVVAQPLPATAGHRRVVTRERRNFQGRDEWPFIRIPEKYHRLWAGTSVMFCS